MKEIRDILRSLDEAQAAGRAVVLATLVAAEGSSYRRPGARMLIHVDGRRVGTISGGCLEEELTRRAMQIRPGEAPVVVRYATGSAEDAMWGYGSGCRGVVHVMLERVDPLGPPMHVAWLRNCLNQRRRLALATVWGVEGTAATTVGSRLMVGSEQMAAEGTWPASLGEAVEADARRVMEQGRWEGRAYGLRHGQVHVLLEALRPPVCLAIVGAGDNSIPLVRLAGELGWMVTVCDRRPAYAVAERFPGAQVVACTPGEIGGWLKADESTAAVVMTHRYAEDLEALRVLLPMPLGYLGILGARKRTRQLLDDLAKDGIEVSGRQRDRLHAPIGLDIGAETPEEIALAIVTEVQAVLSGRAGGKLRDRQGAIHQADERRSLP